MKNTLLIPAAGKSSRFPNMKPKWLLTHPDGQLVIQKVLSAFEFENYDSIILTILKDHEEKYKVSTIIKQIFTNKVELCILPNQTKSAVETIYKTIKQKNIDGHITIKDSDGYVMSEFPKSKNFVSGCKISDFEIREVQNKSFIKHNINNAIDTIEEKNIISDVICVGVYSMLVENFLYAYDNIKNSISYRYEDEMYVSHIVSYLIEKNINFDCVYCQEFKDWGTLEVWRKEQEKHKTYFFDIDGVLLKNTGKYGEKNWYNYFEPIEENVSVLKKLSDEGHQIIFTTSRDKEASAVFIDFLKERNIKFKDIICDCNHSQRIIVNDFANTNPFPSCTSISIPRNSFLENYIK